MAQISSSLYEKNYYAEEQQKLKQIHKRNRQLEMENDILKQEGLILGGKHVIKANARKYTVTAMCKVLQIPISTYYYESKQRLDNNILHAEIRKYSGKARIIMAPKNQGGTGKKEAYCF